MRILNEIHEELFKDPSRIKEKSEISECTKKISFQISLNFIFSRVEPV